MDMFREIVTETHKILQIKAIVMPRSFIWLFRSQVNHTAFRFCDLQIYINAFVLANLLVDISVSYSLILVNMNNF